MDDQRDHLRRIAGFCASKSEVSALEVSLVEDPSQHLKREKLLQYYSLRVGKADVDKLRVNHLLWFIENRPDDEALRGFFAPVIEQVDPDGYIALRAAWMKQLEIHSGNTSVIENAASFFTFNDRKLVEELLLKAQALEPDNAHWHGALAHLYMLGTIGATKDASVEQSLRAVQELESALDQAPSDSEKLQTLTELVKMAAAAGQFEKAESLAAALLIENERHKKDWNYGNAIYEANMALSRVSVVREDLELAGRYLVKASETPGSPQLNSFGPAFELAKELLEKGQKTAVLSYLNNCEKFWSMDFGMLSDWSNEIEQGKIPEFNRFNFKKMTPWKLFRTALGIFKK